MAGHCVVEWFLATQKKLYGAWPIVVVDDSGENECVV